MGTLRSNTEGGREVQAYISLRIAALHRQLEREADALAAAEIRGRVAELRRLYDQIESGDMTA